MNALLAAGLVLASFQITPPPLVGHYTLDAPAGDEPAEVAERASRDVGRFARGRMRARLEEVLTPSRELEIRRDGDAYVVVGDRGDPLVVVPGGPEVTHETPQGETAHVSATLEEGSLVLRIRTSRGERTQTLTPTDAGLKVVTTYVAERLSEPIRMQFVYRRSGP